MTVVLHIEPETPRGLFAVGVKLRHHHYGVARGSSQLMQRFDSEVRQNIVGRDVNHDRPVGHIFLVCDRLKIQALSFARSLTANASLALTTASREIQDSHPCLPS